MKGKLIKAENGWNITEGDIPVHSSHNFWLIMFAHDGMEIDFVLDGGYAILKADGPDTHVYSQD